MTRIACCAAILLACNAPTNEASRPPPSDRIEDTLAQTEEKLVDVAIAAPQPKPIPVVLDARAASPHNAASQCPKGEVYVPPTPPAGFRFRGGTTNAESKNGLPSQEPHVIVLTRGFCMDENEVTVRAYAGCVDAHRCEPPIQLGRWTNYPKLVDHPVNKIPWRDARAYCEFRGQSLPTEAQWEWAATGGEKNAWAWGNAAPSCETSDFTPGPRSHPTSPDGCDGGGTSIVGAHPAGDRIWPSGRIHDLSGNVWEWCLDNYRGFSGRREVDPLHLTREGDWHVVRGGGWNRSGRGIRVDYRAGAPVDYRVAGVGLRCVRNL